jgi:hypothetical protein
MARFQEISPRPLLSGTLSKASADNRGSDKMILSLLFPRQFMTTDIQQDINELRQAATPVQFFHALGQVVEDLLPTTIVGSTPVGTGTMVEGFDHMM